MQAVILAAGKGKRMLPLSKLRHKGMLPVGNAPIIENIIIESQKAGLNDFVVVTSYNSDSITRYFGDGEKLGANIVYCYQKQLTGTGAALQSAQDVLQSKFMVFNSDLLISAADIQKLSSSEIATIGVKERLNPSGFGIVEEQNGRVKRIAEKPLVALTSLVNTGVYVLNNQIFDAIEKTSLSPRDEIELTQALQILIEQDIPVGCTPIESWQDISYPYDMLDANAHLLSQVVSDNKGIIEKNVHIDGTCRIGAGSIIRSGSYIIGPVIIGENCDIGPNCFIRFATAIGNSCRIGSGVEIKNSIVMNSTNISHLSYVGDSIIGENCNLGAGTIIANIRFDKKPVTMNRINTGRSKLGAIIGDDVQTGINVSINAGTIIGNRVRVNPRALAHGNINDDTQL